MNDENSDVSRRRWMPPQIILGETTLLSGDIRPTGAGYVQVRRR